MTDHAHEVFCLEQLLAVLQRRLSYEAMDYDAVVPALIGAIEVAEDSLSPEDEERLAGFRKTHARMYEKPKVPLCLGGESPKVTISGRGGVVSVTDLPTHKSDVLFEVEEWLAQLDLALTSIAPRNPTDELVRFRKKAKGLFKAFERFVRECK
jgi:hypothetical protein